METQTERTDVWTQWVKRGYDKWREYHGNMCTTICKIVSGNLLYDSGNSNWGSVTTQRGGLAWEGDSRWRFKREGKYVYLRPMHVDVWY